jgi:hypothetical protein
LALPGRNSNSLLFARPIWKRKDSRP